MSEFWTSEACAREPERRLPPPRSAWRPGRLPSRIAIAAAALLMTSCGSKSSENRISPIRADIQIDNPASFSDPSIFLQRVSATGDLVVVDVMLRSSAAVTFDTIDIDLKFDPGIVSLGGNVFDPTFDRTPFCAPDASDPQHAITCACNAAVTNVCSGSTTTACIDDSECTSPDTCVPTCTRSPTTNPICLTNAPQADTSGELIMSIAADTGSGCGGFTKAAGSPDLRLQRLGFVAASTGNSTIQFVLPTPPNSGGCAILHNVANVGIACSSGNALFTATR